MCASSKPILDERYCRKSSTSKKKKTFHFIQTTIEISYSLLPFYLIRFGSSLSIERKTVKDIEIEMYIIKILVTFLPIFHFPHFLFARWFFLCVCAMYDFWLRDATCDLFDSHLFHSIFISFFLWFFFGFAHFFFFASSYLPLWGNLYLLH